MKTVCTILAFLTCFAAAPAQGVVEVISVNGSVNPASARFILKSIAHAEESGARALIIELNTPGGLLQSTRDIVSAFLESRVPVIVYVYPHGGRAASAGAFITMGAHIAVMAPGTNIGAAHPVTSGGENKDDSTDISMTKVTNDAAAFARTIAEKRGRNIAWAEEAVRGSVSVTETEAVALNIVDTVAKSLPELLRIVDGREVETITGTHAMRTAGARIERREMPFQLELLNLLSDPNIAYILMMLGIYGLFFELYHPGSIFPGVVGAICLVLAFYSLNTLPLNYAGIALILIGVVLFILEIKIVSHGLLSIGGIASIFLGSVMLIDTPEGIEFMDISLSVIIAVTVVSAAFFLFIVGKGIAAMKRKTSTGSEGLTGKTGTVLVACEPEGKVQVHGEYWKARSLAGAIPAGASVVVVRTTGLTVEVVPAAPSETAGTNS